MDVAWNVETNFLLYMTFEVALWNNSYQYTRSNVVTTSFQDNKEVQQSHFKDITWHIFVIWNVKNHQALVLFFVEFCTHTITNNSSNVPREIRYFV